MIVSWLPVLTSHAGLDACRFLNELSLRDNRVSSMAPLAALTGLRSLDLTGNRIAAIEGLDASSCAPFACSCASCIEGMCCVQKSGFRSRAAFAQ